MVLLGVPNRGANLEAIANLTSAALWSVPTPATRLIGAGLDRRSEGIKDLRWGAVLDEDWVERDPGATERPELHRVQVPRQARFLAVAGSLVDQADADRPPTVNRLLGDALVTAPSAHGRLGDDEPALFPDVAVRLCPRINHVALANRPEVYDEIVRWWDATLTPDAHIRSFGTVAGGAASYRLSNERSEEGGVVQMNVQPIPTVSDRVNEIGRSPRGS